MFATLPQFRHPLANYLFIIDAAGSITRVVYPNGDAFLRLGESD